MAGKRSHTPDRQNQPKKKFKPSPGGIKSQGGPKQIGNGKANKALGSGGKRKNPKALQKWKKKKVYVFKTTKRRKTSLGTSSVVNDGGKLTEDNLAVQKDLNKEKKKKKRRKKKKKKQKDTNTTETPADAVNNGKQNVLGKTGEISSSASEISKESVVINTEKKKKKQKKSKKKKKANSAALAGPDESGDAGSHSKNLIDEKVVNNSGQKARGNEKSKRTNVKVNPTTVTNEEQSNSKKTSEVKSSANDILNGEKKRQGKKSTGLKKWPIGGKGDGGLLPRKPQDISANWKALLPKLDKPKPSKFRNAKQEQSKRPSEIWFDDVDPELLKTNDLTGSSKSSKSDKGVFVIDGAEEGPTKCVALDCEMVGAGHGGRNNILARVSIVNQYGHCLYDKFVRSREEVTDYRTWVSGVRKADLDNGEDFMTVQKEVADLLKGKILVGHALQNDMKVLFLDHPKRMMRDTYHYEPFREMFKSRRPGLKSLVEKILNVKVQQGEHSSVEDAQAVMKLYMLHRKKWETSLKMKPTKKSTT